MNAIQNVAASLAPLLVAGSAWAQNGTVMDDAIVGSGWIGGYGGYWMPTIALAVGVGLVVWVVKQQQK